MATLEHVRYGFTWDGVKVTRTAALPDGGHVITVATETAQMDVYVSPKGNRIRAFRCKPGQVHMGSKDELFPKELP